MRVLVTGVCGFVGSSLVRAWREAGSTHTFVGLDNLIRPGSESNRREMKKLGVELHHADLRVASDFETLPQVDAVVDAAAQPSVLAGVDGRTSSRQLVEHNLFGTVNLLELCRRFSAAFVLLSTSRVYAIEPLASLAVRSEGGAFAPDGSAALPEGVSAEGIDESFPTTSPVSLYGATKLASERLALEYGETFGFPVFIDRCGVLAGAGQFGRADQGIFSFWIHAWRSRLPLTYIGFDGMGHQVRDCLHPADLAPLIDRQLGDSGFRGPRILNFSGGRSSAMSLRQLSAWCEERMGPHPIGFDPRPRPFDLPWVVLDSRKASDVWGFAARRTRDQILEEILAHAEGHPDWLELSGAA